MATYPEKLTAYVFFEIRNDKDRGNLILTARRYEDNDVCFFNYHHQAINQHPEQMQQIVALSKPTTRTKTIRVDIMGFLRNYWNGTSFEFKGVQMNTTQLQSAKVYKRLLNKEVGIMKRKETIAESKQKKVEEKKKKIAEKLQKAEAAFQEEQAKRLADLMKNRCDGSNKP